MLVLALAGIPRRVGWAMGGGAFLLTDVAAWIPGRHEVRSRLALLRSLGIAPDESARVDVHVRDEDRIAMARRLAEAWPRRSRTSDRSPCRYPRPCEGAPSGRDPSFNSSRTPSPIPDDADWLHADRFSPLPPLLAVHLGAGNAAKRWPRRSWKT